MLVWTHAKFTFRKMILRSNSDYDSGTSVSIGKTKLMGSLEKYHATTLELVNDSLKKTAASNPPD